MGLSKLSSGWFSPSFWCRRRPRKPFCRRQPWRLALEPLEDRIVPATDNLDVGGLHFIASDGFQQAPSGDYFVNTGTVSIGYTPVGSENPLPLVQAKALSNGGSVQNAFFILKPDQTLPSFEVTHAELDLVVVGGSPSKPLPIWKSTDPDFTETFDIDELKTTGVLLQEGDNEPITVANVDFTVSTLLFHNPDSGTTAHAQVKMQGDASFDQVPLVKDFGITAHVGGPNDPQNNYVIADHAGITLTGLDVTKDLPSNVKVTGLALSGTVTIGYSHDDNSFAFGGTVHLTSEDQGSGQVALNNVKATLEVAVVGGSLGTFGFGISTGFHIFDLNVSTTNEQPLLFKYNAVKDQFEIRGGLQLEFNFNTISTTLDDGMGGPGIVIVGGHLTQFHAIVNADFQLFGATVKATNLTFEYTADNGHGQSQFEMYGDLSLTIPTENQIDTTITAHLGTQADPGLVLQNGTLTQINMGVSGRFDVFGLQIATATAGANLEWQKTDNTFLISGDFTADFKVFQVSVTLGNSPTTGLVIKDGHFQLKDAKFELDNAPLGPVTLKQLVVAWQEEGTPGVFTIDVAGKVLLPGGWEVDAALVFDQKGLNTIAVSASLGEGIPIADTGLFITELGGSIQNLDNPSQIIVSAHLGVTWGETFTLFGKEVKLFRAEGDITVDANELILSGSVQIGAYTTDNGTTWQAVGGSGDARLTLDWGDKLYSLHVDVNGLFTVFDLSGDLTFNAGKEIKFLATAAVVIPPQVPFIGGDKIAGVGFYFDHVFKHDNVPTSTTVAAWIDLDIIWSFEVGFEYVYTTDKDHPNGLTTFSLIGAGTIDNFKAEAMDPVNQTYTYTADLGGLVPANATYATLSADWSKVAPGVTIVGQPKFRVQRTLNGQTTTITEDQFAANGIQLIDDPHFSWTTRKAIQIVGSTTDAYAPITGDYKLLVDVTTDGGNPFPDYPNPSAADVLKIQATWHVPKPTFGPRDALPPYVPVVPPTPSGTFPVTLQGTIDEGFLTSGKATVSVFRVLVQDPQQRAVLLGTSPLTKFSGNGLNWQATVNVPIEGLYPLPYTVYAVVNDGFNVPVKTANSAPFTPMFAVIGSVSNQAHDAKTGWWVWLDYNRDSRRQANEPIYQTSNPDGFFAFTPTFDPSTGWDPVPVGNPFDVRLIVPAPQNFAPVSPVTLTYNGTGTEQAPFQVMEKTAISGVVFSDLHSGRQGLAGWTAYLDTNGNGRLDGGEPSTLTDGDGRYSFHDLPPNTKQTVRVQLQEYYLKTSPQPTFSYTVAVGSEPFKIYDNNDFGVQPFPTISGTVSVEPQTNGVLGPFTSPQQGVTVNLLKNGNMIATTTSAADGSYSFPPVLPGTYTVSQAVDERRFRQITPAPSQVTFQPPGGSNTFQFPGSPGSIAGSVALADFNGDGFLDAAVLNTAQEQQSPQVWIYYNSAAGFSPPVAVPTGAVDSLVAAPVQVVAGHFSSSGNPELAVLYNTGLVTLLRNQGGSLQPGVTLTDSLPEVNPLPGVGYMYMVKGHFFKDLSLDQLAVPLQNGTTNYNVFTFAAPPNNVPVDSAAVAGVATDLAAGDINQDGITDLFLPNQDLNTPPTVEYGNGDGTFTSKTIDSLPGGGTQAVVGDINGDGRPDLGIFDSDGAFHYAIQDVSGGFTQVFSPNFPTGVPIVYASVLQDINYDFRPDLVWLNTSGGGLSVAINTGTPNNWFSASQYSSWPTLGLSPDSALAVGPLRKEPLGDVVLTGQNQNGFYVQRADNLSGVQVLPATVTVQGGQNATGVDFVNVDLGQKAQPLVPIDGAPAVIPPAPSGPFAVPVLDRVVVNRRRQRGYRPRVLGTTLIFNVPLNLDPRALRLVRHRPGNRKQDLSRWIQTVMVVQNGQTWANLRFRSPRGALLPRGRYSLVLQGDLLRNALTGASLAAPGGGERTELPL
jgi:hypothetical protein